MIETLTQAIDNIHGMEVFLKKYIVSVYRDDKNKPRSIVGVVEEVGIEGKKAFTNFDELWEILNSAKKEQFLCNEKNGICTILWLRLFLSRKSRNLNPIFSAL